MVELNKYRYFYIIATRNRDWNKTFDIRDEKDSNSSISKEDRLKGRT